jgi:phage tail-like protein
MSHNRAILAALLFLVAFAPLRADSQAVGQTIQVTINGEPVRGFVELTGIRTEIEVVPLYDASDPNPKLTIGRRKPGSIVLKRGVAADTSLWDWYSNVINGASDKRTIQVTVYNRRNKPVARYHLENAWPSTYEVSAFTAESGRAALETVTMTCEFIQRVPV